VACDLHHEPLHPLGIEAIHMRRSFDALGQCVGQVFKQNPESGAVFISAGKRRTT
jgi:hypothetical protein